MLRIIAGRFRGRRLQTPPGLAVRPTGDRVKQTLFDILQGFVPGSRVLDLYAGSGNLGLEALSRGARHVVLVERAPAALQAIAANLQRLDAASEVEVVRAEALRYLAGSHAEPFDLVLADPPYADGVEDALLAAASGAVRPGGCLVLQHDRHWRVATVSGWRHAATRQFGETGLDFFWREEADRDGSAAPHGALPGDV